MKKKEDKKKYKCPYCNIDFKSQMEYVGHFQFRRACRENLKIIKSMGKQKDDKIMNIMKYLSRRYNTYDREGFSDYSDVEDLIDCTDKGDKEIKRTQFLLETVETVFYMLK